MNAPMVYMGHPIDYGRLGKLAVDVKVDMVKRGWLVFDPLEAFGVMSGVEPDRRIRSVNHQAMSRSDGMLALLASDCVSIGVPMEIERMHSGWGKPVAVVGHGVWRSWSLVEMPGVAVFDLDQGGRIEDALAWLEEAMHDRGIGRVEGQPILFQVDSEEGGRLPTQAYTGDAGFDLYVARDMMIQGGDFVDVPHAIRVQPPDHIWCRIAPRSSTLRKRGLLVAEGIIDQGYRGDLYTGVRNLGADPVRVKAGERISQLIPHSLSARVLRPVAVRDLDASPRGGAGFGSSGA